MTKQTRTVCDECQGVIPDGAQYVSGVSLALVLSTGPAPYGPLDFCSTAHLVAYVQAQPPVAPPATSYPLIPAQ